MQRILREMSLNSRFMLAPIIGITLTTLLASLFFSSTAVQREKLLLIQNQTLSSSKEISHLSSRLAENHSRVYELLTYAAKDGDESQLYDMGKPLLNEVHKIEYETKRAIQNARLSSPLLPALAQYRKNLITAVEMSTVDLSLATQFMTQASGEFNKTNSEFLNLHKNMQNRIENKLLEFHSSAEKNMHQFILLFFISIIIVLVLSCWLSKILSRDLKQLIDTLSKLATTENKLDNTSEIQQLSLVIQHVKTSHSKLKKIRTDLSHQEKRLRTIQDNMLDGIITINEDGRIESFSKSAEKIFGYHAAEIIGKNIKILTTKKDQQQHDNYIQQYLETSKTHVIGTGREVMALRKDNSVFPMHLSVTELPFGDSAKRHFIGACRDITEVKQHEEMLRRSLKMDAMGKLTGGIAHDYNNMLGVVIGYSDLLAKELKDQAKLKSYVDKINHATERGINLTKKLLSFSRQQPLSKEKHILNKLLQDESHMLRTTLTARIKLQLNLQPDLWPVEIDRSDFEDAILNLCINAMHAIKNSGNLTLKTENFALFKTDKEVLKLCKGEYVLLSICDTGCGMSKDVLSKIFDPFFSTKGEMGSGLGLSQVYGFMERCGGTIKVYSEVAQGTQFSLYFPRLRNENNELKTANIKPKIHLQGDELILLVDDENDLLNLSTTILEQQGYQVLQAESASQALSILNTKNIDLMISDIIMPEIDGIELAEIVQKNYPLIKIMLTSGFSDNRQLRLKDRRLQDNLLHKPYKAQELLAQVRKLLDT